MELKLPLPLLWLICALLIWSTADLFPAFRFPYHRPLALLLISCSALIAALSVSAFCRANTTLDPKNPQKTTALLQTGIYRFSRNPMYLSLVFALAAFACWFKSAVGFPIILLFTGYMTHFQIIPEEKALERKFGRQYIDYRRRGRRWI